MRVTIKCFSKYWLALGCVLWAGSAMALVQELTAVFRPDPVKPDHNQFVNTTPVSGYCATWPDQCRGRFSIRLPLEIRANGPMAANPSDWRQAAYWKAPAQWRSFTVVNSLGEEETVEMRISGIGSTYHLDRPAAELVGGGVPAVTGHNKLWGLSWVSAPKPCQYSGVGFYGDAHYGFMWKTPVEERCVKLPKYPIPFMTYDYLDIVYELRTPNPLQMSAGLYSGTLTYGLGPFQDFDFGDVMQPLDSALSLNFSLTVEHILRVVLPAGGNRIELLPQGGWQAWLHQGRPPSRLFRDQTFALHASSRFKMQLECGLVIGNTCGLRNEQGDEVPLQVGVTLPHGLIDQYGQAVTKRPLRLDGSGTELFQPVSYVNNRPASLHFEVEKADVSQMLKKPGSTYTGVATVIWDSEV